MDQFKDFKHTQIPFGKPIPIPRDSIEVLVNYYAKPRAFIKRGIVIIQVKKSKGKRELVLIDTNVKPPTIEFAIEETSG
jgi:hypothetical protein